MHLYCFLLLPDCWDLMTVLTFSISPSQCSRSRSGQGSSCHKYKFLSSQIYFFSKEIWNTIWIGFPTFLAVSNKYTSLWMISFIKNRPIHFAVHLSAISGKMFRFLVSNHTFCPTLNILSRQYLFTVLQYCSYAFCKLRLQFLMSTLLHNFYFISRIGSWKLFLVAMPFAPTMG